MKQFNRVFNFNLSLACSLVLGAMAGSSASASVVDLGDASGFAVLATDGSVSTSDSAFQGSIGVAAAGFNYSQSGGGETDIQKPEIAYINSGSSGNGPSNVTIQQGASTNAFLAQAVNDATNASNSLAALAPTESLGAVTQAMTISESAVGNYVLSISSINLNQAALTLSAPAGSTFVVNINGSITLNGGSQGNGLLVGGGLKASDVVYNILGTGNQVTTTGGGNAQDIQGAILDLGGSVNLHPGEVDQTIVAQSFTSSSGSLVAPPPVPVPEANAGWILGALFPLFLLVTPARLRKYLGDLRSA